MIQKTRKQKKKKKSVDETTQMSEREKRRLTSIRRQMIDDFVNKNFGEGDILIYADEQNVLNYINNKNSLWISGYGSILLRLNPSTFESTVEKFETRREAARKFVKNHVRNDDMLEQLRELNPSVEDILSSIRDY